MIGIVDYEAGNIASVSNALNAVGARFMVSGDPTVLKDCDGIILPGVGAAPGAMAALRQRDLGKFLSQCTQPLLGICLGMQLLYQSSEEGKTTCIGVFPGPVMKFDETRLKVPHMGWNEVNSIGKSPLMNGISEKEYFYFAHSYYVKPDPLTVATSTQDQAFAAVVVSGHYYGVQFHPEKSGSAGLAVLHNFDLLCK
jgi:imidazole glycerol-phosphate synthase subunit HisH